MIDNILFRTQAKLQVLVYVLAVFTQDVWEQASNVELLNTFEIDVRLVKAFRRGMPRSVARLDLVCCVLDRYDRVVFLKEELSGCG